MTNFIQQIALFIQNNYPTTSHLTVILPSQRAKKYIQEALFDVKGQPFFSPNFITINTWINELVPEKIISSVELLFELYAVHKELAEEPESFDDFMRWGKLLLNDCDEIDRYLLNSEDLFKNLLDVKQIENWSFDSTKELTENQKKFLEFWEKMRGYYTALNNHLAAKDSMYPGAAYRKVAENIDLAFSQDTESHFLFVGFNALSKAELSIMKQLVAMGRANVLIEGDDFFVKDNLHEAGKFLRQIKEEIPETHLFSSNKLLSEHKQFEVIRCAQPTSQVKAAMTLLKKLKTEELKETLLLLADESLIVPAIKHIPAEVGEANITLGLPLKNTLLRTWVDLLFEIQENILYFKTTAAYHKTLKAFLQHPFFRKFIPAEEQQLVEQLLLEMVKFNKLFSKTEFDVLSPETNRFIHLAFAPWENNWSKAIESFRKINTTLFPVFDKELDLLERSALSQFDEALRELVPIFTKQLPDISLYVFKQLVNPFWMNKTVAYYGNPTEGLQIMGLLETRMLDFKQIIVIGLNEGKMPPNNVIQTIIPMDLRRYFGLPTPADKDALFAHHFYRLLPGVEKCWITYNSSPGEGLVANEPSRYLRQLELELVRENEAIEWHTSNFELAVDDVIKAQSSIPNTLEIQSAILAYFERGVSASALNKFLTCPMDFYYRYVLGLFENDEVEEDIESSTFGEIVHNTLEELYKPFVVQQVNITEFDMDNMLKTYPLELQRQFAATFNAQKEVYEKGRNHLSFKMAAYQIERFLKAERKLLQEHPTKQLFILSLEDKLETTVDFKFEGKNYPLKIKGLIDRVDSWGDKLRIVDYKTGKCNADEVNMGISKELIEEDFERVKRKLSTGKYVLQLGMYNLLYYKTKQVFPHQSGIISMTNLSSGFQSLTSSKNDLTIDAEHIETIELLIQEIAHQILNCDAFAHNPKAKYCEYC